jgi:hypothetical protein
MGMFDLPIYESRPGTTQDQQEPQPGDGSSLATENLDQFNQHILLGVQAVGRLKSAFLVRNS